MISFRTKIKTKPKHELAISSFRGVDLTSNETKIDTARASEMINFLPDNGGLRKRRGYEQVLAVPDELPINGIYRYSETILIVHAGARFFEFTASGNTFTRRELNASITASRMINEKSYAFRNHGKLFIIGCGDYLVYGDFGTGSNVLLPVTDCSDSLYVPTTTINIDPIGTENDVRATLEGVNLLTPWRKNTLVGPSTAGNASWIIDGSVDGDYYHGDHTIINTLSEVTVTVETLETVNDRETIVLRTYKTCGPSLVDHFPLVGLYLCDDQGQPSGEAKGYVEYRTGVIDLYIGGPPPVEGKSNITVKFRHTVEGSKERIRSCMCGTTFGVGGNNGTLFLAGNPTEKNLQFYSEPDNFFYFPDQNITAIGSDTEAIKGMIRIDEQTLLTVKDGEDSGTVFYQTGSWKDVYDANGSLIDMYQVFPVSTGSMNEKIISRSIHMLAGDPLLICRNGVFGIQSTTAGVQIVRNLQERSRNIRTALQSADLSGAEAVVRNGVYFLAVNDADGTVYAADASLICYPQDSALKQRQYEWFVLKNIKARVWTEINHELWFGTPDGRICKVSDDYMDSITGSPAVSVSALWMSAAIDCGDSSVSKTLLSVTANVENTATEVKVGVKTANREKRKKIKGLEALDFGDFDMDRLSLYNEFPDTYTVRLKERNFNFVKFRISSTQAGPCRINGLSALYKINKQNKGVR